MELTLPLKLRIAAAVAAGVFLIGIFAWPLVDSAGSFDVVLTGSLGLGAKAALLLLAVFAGFIACLICWPYGREIGILAVPSGLAVWALRTADVTAIILQNPSVQQRHELYTSLKWDPLFWLLVVAAGFAGVILGQIITLPRRYDVKTGDEGIYQRNGRFSRTLLAFGDYGSFAGHSNETAPADGHNPVNSKEKSPFTTGLCLRAAAAVIASVLIAQACIAIFARDVSIFDSRLGLISAQPSLGQIVFAVFLSFGLAGFVVKLLLNRSYIWPMLACAFVTTFVNAFYLKALNLQQLAETLPLVFTPHTALAIVPVQMVSFGTLGSIAGYWMAAQYDHWRRHEAR